MRHNYITPWLMIVQMDRHTHNCQPGFWSLWMHGKTYIAVIDDFGNLVVSWRLTLAHRQGRAPSRELTR